MPDVNEATEPTEPTEIPCDGCGETPCVPCGTCERCASECECWICDACGARHASDAWRCDRCDRCEGCCECHSCQSCGDRFGCDDYCHDCERCASCCTCDRDAGRPLARCETRRGVFHGEPSRRYPRFLGVEIECGVRGDRPDYSMLREAVQTWGAGVHDDGSLDCQNDMEIVTCPARGDAFKAQIAALCAGLDRAGGYVDRSCGTHVHVDARDYSTPDLLKLVRLYRKVEDGLYAIVAPSRRSNHYSRPWGQHFAIAGVFKRLPVAHRARALDVALYGSEEAAEAIKARPYKHSVRYHGLNLNAILLHGTVEFRLHQGTVNARKILMWAAVCAKLVEYAKRTGETTIANLTGDSFEILCTVVKDREVVAWMRERRDYFATRDARRVGAPVVGATREAEASEA